MHQLQTLGGGGGVQDTAVRLEDEREVCTQAGVRVKEAARVKKQCGLKKRGWLELSALK